MRAALRAAERLLAGLVAVACALILLGGVGIVFAGVVWRYLLDDPLEWTDEVALAVLVATTFGGAALTLQRREHLGIRALRTRLGARWGGWADGFATAVVFAVSACLTAAAVPLLESVAGQTTVSGLLPASIDYWPVLVGAAAMTVFAAFQLLELPPGAALVPAVVVAALAGLAALWGEYAPAAPNTGIWAMIVADAACLAAAVPVAFALAAGSLVYIAVTGELPLVQFSQQMQAGVGNYVLLSIPFFVLAGLVMGVNGMSVRLVAFLDMLCGRVRGGLGVVTVVAMAVFSGISGSKSADVAAIGSIMLPAVRRTGGDEREGVALLAASAVMGETIPPCINMIILGYVANVSIGGLFIAGLLPAAVMAVVLIAVTVLGAGRRVGRGGPRRSLLAVWRITGGALTAFVLVVIIVGGIVGGVATPTEVSAVAVLYALVVGALAFREMTWRGFADFLVRSASLSGMILFIIAAAEMLSYLLTVNLIPQQMAAGLAGLGTSVGPWLFILVAIVMLVVMGSVLEGAPALIVFGPLLFPAAQRLGIHPLHFGIVLVIAMGIGLFAPPLGVGLYTACAVGEVSMESVARPMLKYLLVLTVALLLIAFVPAITLALPHWLGVS